MRKRILHLTYDMRIGGTEQVIKNLIEGSDEQLFDMSIFCIETPIGPFGKMLIENGTTISSHRRKDGFDLSLIGAIRTHLKQNKIDIIHCHQYTPWVYGTLAAAGTKTRVIFTEHGRFYPDSSSWKRKLVNPVLAHFTDHITAISKATKQALIDFEFINPARIEVVYNGIQPLEANAEKTKALKKELSIADGTNVLGTIARLDPIKNHKMMFEAFKLVLEKHSNTVLILVGDGEERQNLEALAKTLTITDKVIFTGYIDKPQAYLNCMDIFLLSSLSEGTSMTLLEAMSLSKPCVVTDAGGNAEIIRHNENGLVTENNNTVAFSDAIATVLDNQTVARNMRSKAFEIFNQKFLAATMCNCLKPNYTNTGSQSDE
jgi:glycosyltransferase involved in cell wall biosynthesis